LFYVIIILIMSTNESIDYLRARGIAIEVAPNGNRLAVGRLSLEAAVDLGHALTLELDARHGDRAMYRPDAFVLAKVLAEAQQRMASGEARVFGETRPDERNMAVRVDRAADAFALTADVRNAYEDHPELGGGALLQAGFIAVTQTIDLS
jgi:hypothetical protein